MEKFFYSVEEGDTLYLVANKLSVPSISIVKNNNLKRELQAGDLIYVEKDNCTVYKVMPFDTAKSVAKKFGVNEQELLKKNGVEYFFYGLTIKI